MLFIIGRLAILLLLFAGQAHAQHTYSTNFTATENPISEGGKWLNGATNGLDWCDVQKTPGLAFGVGPCATNFSDPTAVLTNSAGGSGVWGPNQGASATVFIGTLIGTFFPEVELRLNTTITAHNITGYEITCDVGTSINHPDMNVSIVRWNGPPATSNNSNNAFTTLIQSNGQSCKNGDVLSGYNINGNIYAFINGKFIVGVTDTTYSNGSPGIGFDAGEGSQYNQAALTNFTATDSPVTSSWFGIISPPRGIDWSQKGFPGSTPPSVGWPICTTIAPYRSMNSCAASYCISFHKASCASVTSAFWPTAYAPHSCLFAFSCWVRHNSRKPDNAPLPPKIVRVFGAALNAVDR
jgi:hypothetical protein